jgi:hypothetical protein
MARQYDDYEEDVLGDVLGTVLNPIGTIASGIGHLISPQPPRPPLQQLPPSPPPNGVGTATLTTPQGNATLRLPSEVVSVTDFQRVTSDLQDKVGQAVARLNTLDRDTGTKFTQLTSAVADANRDIAAARRSQSEAAARLRRQMSDQQTMSIMMSLMMQTSLSNRVAALEANDKITPASDNSMSLMMLPMAFMSPDGDGDKDGGSSNSMMMMMVMLALTGALGGK